MNHAVPLSANKPPIPFFGCYRCHTIFRIEEEEERKEDELASFMRNGFYILPHVIIK